MVWRLGRVVVGLRGAGGGGWKGVELGVEGPGVSRWKPTRTDNKNKNRNSIC